MSKRKAGSDIRSFFSKQKCAVSLEKSTNQLVLRCLILTRLTASSHLLLTLTVSQQLHCSQLHTGFSQSMLCLLQICLPLLLVEWNTFCTVAIVSSVPVPYISQVNSMILRQPSLVLEVIKASLPSSRFRSECATMGMHRFRCHFTTPCFYSG